MFERQQVILSKKALEVVLAFWQQVLRLADWEIEVRVVGLDALPEGAHGCCQSFPSTQQALIQLINEKEYKLLRNGDPYDMEATLCHELLHVRDWAWYPAEGTANLLYEQDQELTAQALVALKRQMDFE